MASVETGPITTGWGDYVAPYTTLDVSNKAVGGCSARSFTREGRFDAIAAEVRAGNWVIIEFGHNDGRSLSTHNGRTDCSGTGDEMCTTTYDGQTETGADISGIFEEHGQATPNNPWETGTFYSPSRFVEYAKLAAEAVGVA
ncbi:hypothetical protein NUU61_003427 [Penicillium alfredii]|uniref:Rhamnogalacturonan acetylesterase n=1 Tax=Penicillium alfredii TaxID=1506179 RepID=A0A9W9KGX2_9EURO|nr:uncharacterized protein NUU61_003427 [Penicillium alfredii]KAJ5106080.1 hypothetical protein NUU61_003427 [Penicillium alfredii]